jgi:hypothetical protein
LSAVAYNTLGDLTVTCSGGESVVGGGGGLVSSGVFDTDANEAVLSSPVVDAQGAPPSGSGVAVTGWRLVVRNMDTEGLARDLRAYVLCARP